MKRFEILVLIVVMYLSGMLTAFYFVDTVKPASPLLYEKLDTSIMWRLNWDTGCIVRKHDTLFLIHKRK